MMPPKNNITLGTPYIMIGDKAYPLNQDTVSISIEEEVISDFNPTTLRFSFKVKTRRRKLVRFMQEIGMMKKPKLTYKTNRFWKNNKPQ